MKINSKQIKDSVEWLMKEKESCVHFKTGYTNNLGQPLCIVFGWADDYELNTHKYQILNSCINCMIAFNHSTLQCDYFWDFQMPVDNKGVTYDTDTYVGEDFEATAEYLNKELKYIVKEFCNG